MSPEVLLSAMYLEDESFIDTLNIHTDCVVINQCDRQCDRKTVRPAKNGDILVTYIETGERGLSKSRNMAIRNASGPICILCDNDVEYVSDYDSMINDAFSRHPDADVIVFFVKRPERDRPVFDRPHKMSWLSVLKIFSPEIAFRKDSVKDIRFNELFGAGARFFMGEENLFLYECLRRRLKIVYVPEMIAAVRHNQSTWFNGYDEAFFVSRGANFAALSGTFSLLLILQYALRKRRLYKENLTVPEAIRGMLKGRRQYFDIVARKHRGSR